MGKIELDHTGAGSGVTLSSDGTDLLLNGTAVGGGGGGASALTIDDKTAAYTVVAGDLGKIINCTSNTFTVSLTAAATLGAGFHCWIRNSSVGPSDVITVAPSGAEKIDELATIGLRNKEQIHITSTGTGFIIIRSKLSAFSDNFDGGGFLPTASGRRAIAIGSNAAATGDWSNALGLNTSATANHATAIGQNSFGAGSQAVTGAAMALGGSYASGNSSFAAAIANDTSSYGASGSNSVAIGSLAKATGADAVSIGESSQATSADAIALGRMVRATSSYATAMGYNCLSSAAYSVALGYQATASGSNAIAAGASSTYGERATASGNGSVALGGAYATAQDSVSIGASSTTGTTIGKIAFSNDKFSANGDSQHGLYVLRSDTTDATTEALSTNLLTAGFQNQITLSSNSAYAFHGTIVARQQASQGTACAAWKVEGLIRKEGSAVTTVLVNSATTVLDNTPAWGMALSADTTNGALKIEVTGAAATNIRWVATIHTSEVTY